MPDHARRALDLVAEHEERIASELRVFGFVADPMLVERATVYALLALADEINFWRNEGTHED